MADLECAVHRLDACFQELEQPALVQVVGTAVADSLEVAEDTDQVAALAVEAADLAADMHCQVKAGRKHHTAAHSEEVADHARRNALAQRPVSEPRQE